MEDSPRIAILGTGGIGKTALALSALHHAEVEARFPQRYFISCESASNSADIVLALATQFDVAASGQLLKAVVRHLSNTPEKTLLVLDNLENAWEAPAARADVEGLLAHLTDIFNVALLVTMRGSERPAKVRWSRPFLPPLESLSREAAVQTLVDIVDDDEDDNGATRAQMHKILDFTDNMPLAVTLLGAIISCEGYTQTIERWKLENTALLSEGHAKDSNLNKSIAMSLSSPRITVAAGARELLSVLCLLPGGILDSELAMLGLPIADLGRAKAALLRTSLAYGVDGRLRTLAPVRQYIETTCPPTPTLVQPLLHFLHELLDIWNTFLKLPSGDLVPRLKANIGNFRAVFIYAAKMDSQSQEDLVETGKTLLKFVYFLAATAAHEGGGAADMQKLLPDIVERARNDDLYGRYFISKFIHDHDYGMADAEALIARAIQHFRNAGNHSGKAALYNTLAGYYHARSQMPRAWEYSEQALEIGREVNDFVQQCIAVHWMAEIHYRRGDYAAGVARGVEGRRLAERCGNFPLQADCIRAQALSCVALGDFKTGVALCADARKLLLACALGGGDTDLRLMNLEAEILYQKSEYATSLALHRASALLTSPTVRPLDHAYALVNIAGIEIITGAADESVLQSLNGARDIFKACSYPRGICNCDVVLADLYYRQGKLADAQALYEKCLRIARGRDAEIPILCLEKLGDLRRDLQDVPGTLCYRAVFLAWACKGKNAAATLQALLGLGDAMGRFGYADTDVRNFEAALHGFSTMGIIKGIGECGARIQGRA